MTCFQRGRPFLARRHLREAVRQNPGNGAMVEAFERIDLNTRWVTLPNYYLSLVMDRLPGGTFGLWGIVVVTFIVLEKTRAQLASRLEGLGARSAQLATLQEELRARLGEMPEGMRDMAETRIELGITYQFGSRFAAIVNPRFGQ